jgi:hypothetical protein
MSSSKALATRRALATRVSRDRVESAASVVRVSVAMTAWFGGVSLFLGAVGVSMPWIAIVSVLAGMLTLAQYARLGHDGRMHTRAPGIELALIAVGGSTAAIFGQLI